MYKISGIQLMSEFEKINFRQDSYNLLVIFKNAAFPIVFLVLAPLVGFSIPDVNLYNLTYNAILSNLLPSGIVIVILAVVVIIDYLILRFLIHYTYALKKQATLASLIIFSMLMIFSFFGFWYRIDLGYQITQNTSQENPPPSCIPVLLTISLTSSLFSVVYGLAVGKFSEVDYSGFQMHIDDFFESVLSLSRIADTKPGLGVSQNDVKKLQKNLDEAIKDLEENTPKETRLYAKFIKEALLNPLEILKKTFDEDAFRTPQIVVELPRAITPYDPLKNEKWVYQHLSLMIGG